MTDERAGAGVDPAPSKATQVHGTTRVRAKELIQVVVVSKLL